MQFDKYGPFATTIAVATCLFAVFSFLLLKMVGRVNKWTWLIQDTPPFVVTLAVRAIVIALIAATFLTIDKSNYRWFGGFAILFAISAAILTAWFDSLRRKRTCEIPMLAADGSHARNWLGRPVSRRVVIGAERDMKPEVLADYRQHHGLSLQKFLSGFGENQVNNPEALWDKDHLAGIANKMTIILGGILLSAVMALYLAAAAIEMQQRSPDQSEKAQGPTAPMRAG